MFKIIGENEFIDIKKVGGKSAHLNRLNYQGLPVPKGIIIENDYFQGRDTNKNEFMSYLDPNKLYAIRSSALDEDGSNFSFAGLQDTYLNIEYKDIIEKIELCYQSQFNERAQEYRKNLDIGQSNGMSVVVQEMVDADYAGVIFTQNPLNNRIDQMVIEVVEGLGEKLVSGYQSPSTYTVSKQNLSVTSMIKEDQNLSQELINELVANAKIIEKLYGIPQDIEFAIMDKKVYILQARPITTTTLLPNQKKEGLRFYLSFAHVQNMTYPMTPVGAEMIQKLFTSHNHKFTHGFINYNGAFVFLDISELLLTPTFLHNKLIKLLENINFNLPELADQYRQQNKKRRLLPFQLVRVQLKLFKSFISIYRKKETSNTHLIEFLDQYVEEIRGYDDNKLLKVQEGLIFPVFEKLIPYIILGIMSFFRLKKLFNRYGLDMEDFNTIVSGLDGNITAEMGLLFDDMLLNHGSEKGHELFRTYMDEFGMRTDGEIDLGRDRPNDDIEKFKDLVDKMAAEHNGESLRKKHYARIDQADKVLVKLEKQVSKKQFAKLNFWIVRLKQFYILREHPKHTLMKIFDRYRDIIETPFESFDEKVRGGCSKEVISQRQELYTGAYNKTIPLAILSNGLILKPRQENPDGSIKGFGVSPGVVKAKVRVIVNIHDDIIHEGEILVTKFTDPGWTPMLAKAAGIITEVGGMMTHGAIVAREYGIPAVVGIEACIDKFKTGDLITMNGDLGTIVIESRSS